MVGTGAMTSDQNWVSGLTGAEPSQTPALYGTATAAAYEAFTAR